MSAHSRGPACWLSCDREQGCRRALQCIRPRGQQHSMTWQHCKQQAYFSHLHAGRRQPRRQTRTRCLQSRSQMCQSHRPPCGSASGPPLRRRRGARAQRATTRALPHGRRRPARRPPRRRRARAGPETCAGRPEQAHSRALQLRARPLGAHRPCAWPRLPGPRAPDAHVAPWDSRPHWRGALDACASPRGAS